MAALVLGLLVASAKGFYDTQTTELTQMSANIMLLDRGLAQYGLEAKEAREALSNTVAVILDQTWSKNRSRDSRLEPTALGAHILFNKIQALNPKDDTHRLLKSQILN